MNASYPMEKQNDISVIRLLLILGVFIIGVFYTIGAFSNNDLLWFLPRFEARPQEIRVYHDGETTVIRPGTQGYQEIIAAFNPQIAKPNRFLDDFGLSETSVTDARELYTTIELIYAEPVKLHTNISLGEPTSFLVPITGRHSERQAVFMGYGELGYLPGAFLLNDRSGLDQALRNLELLK